MFGFSWWVIAVAVAIVAVISFIYDIDWWKIALVVIAVLFVSGLYRDGKLPENLEPIAEKVFFWVDKEFADTNKSKSIKNIDKDNIFRPAYDVGTCRELSGTPFVLSIYVDDDESSWTAKNAETFQNNAVLPDLAFLNEQATKWGGNLSLRSAMYVTDSSNNIVVRYDGTILTGKDGEYTPGREILNQVASSLGFSTSEEFYRYMQEFSGEEQVAILLLVNKDGRSYSTIDFFEDASEEIECAVVFSSLNGRETASVNHEFLHLFGAEDLYQEESTGGNAGRAVIAKKYYPDDIMLVGSSKTIGAYTAYAVGWTDEVPEECTAPEFWEGHWSREE